MKKVILSFLCLTVGLLNSYSQAPAASSFSLLDTNNVDITGTTRTVYVAINNQYKNVIKIKNNTGSDVDYKVERIYMTSPICSGTDIFFCAAGLCLPPDSMITQPSPNGTILANQTLPAGPGTFGIEPHFDVGATCCTEDVMYKVININNTSDFVTIIMHYDCANSIDESVATVSLSAFPNPADKLLHFKYRVNNSNDSKINVYDMLGKKIKEITLQQNAGITTIDVSEIKAGMYFYSLETDNKITVAQKIIIGVYK